MLPEYMTSPSYLAYIAGQPDETGEPTGKR
jgi:hypothetical protein